MSQELNKLKQALLTTYGSFADKRIKNIEKGRRFLADERTKADFAADGKPFGWFCEMYLDVEGADEVTLSIVNIPISGDVSDWMERHAEAHGQFRYTVTISRGEQADLAELAKFLRAITAPGRRYDTKHYKYSVPRAALSLDKLRAALDEGWRE